VALLQLRARGAAFGVGGQGAQLGFQAAHPFGQVALPPGEAADLRDQPVAQPIRFL
jgi:hypothetical protein